MSSYIYQELFQPVLQIYLSINIRMRTSTEMNGPNICNDQSTTLSYRTVKS